MWSVPSLRLRPSDAHLRAGDADRARAADELTRHCAAGRLTPEELSERLDTVLGARTLGELEAVRRDLPALAPAAGPKRRAPRRLLAAIVLVLSMLILAVLGAGVLEWAAQEPGAAVVLLLLLLVLGALVVAALGSLVLTLAPLIAVGIGMRWLARHLGELRAAAPASRRDLRA